MACSSYSFFDLLYAANDGAVFQLSDVLWFPSCSFFVMCDKERTKPFGFAQGRESAAPMTPSLYRRHIGAFP